MGETIEQIVAAAWVWKQPAQLQASATTKRAGGAEEVGAGGSGRLSVVSDEGKKKKSKNKKKPTTHNNNDEAHDEPAVQRYRFFPSAQMRVHVHV